jgi:hypothetical protein
MTYALSRDADIAMAFPDVCYMAIIPISGTKVPLPIPNLAKLDTAEASIKNVKIKSLPALVLTDEVPQSNGNEPSVAFGGGLISGKAMGKARWLLGSTCVFMKGKPALSMPYPTFQNADNAPGFVLSVKQKVVQIRR